MNPHDDLKEINGSVVTSPKRDHRQEVTDSIIQMLEQGVAPWQKPWEPGALEIPFNPTTGRPYRGGNALSLMCEGIREGYGDPRFLTLRQANEQGWQVRKGEKASYVEYWEFRPPKIQDSNVQGKEPAAHPAPEAADRDAARDYANDRPDSKEARNTANREKPGFVHRVYAVFNAKQIDGIPPYEPKRRQEWEVVQSAEEILKNSGASISHDQNDGAFYSPATDNIHLPPKAAFKTPGDYYGTALHEAAHWTGHHSRLDRQTLTDGYRFGDPSYAKEELRAELASAFLSAERGIPHDTERHAAYVGSWIKSLKSDKNEIFRAAKDASLATDFLLALEREKSVPKALEAVGIKQARTPFAGAANLAQSFAEAKGLTAGTLGETARTRVAQTDSGIYHGEIIGETQQHVIQKISPQTAVAHMKQLFEAAPAVGENVTITYSRNRPSVKPYQAKTKAKELGR